MAFGQVTPKQVTWLCEQGKDKQVTRMYEQGYGYTCQGSCTYGIVRRLQWWFLLQRNRRHMFYAAIVCCAAWLGIRYALAEGFANVTNCHCSFMTNSIVAEVAIDSMTKLAATSA